MPLFLRLISSDIHNKEVSLSATEFNTLRILFKIVGPDGKQIENIKTRPNSATSTSKNSQGCKPLSAFANFFN